MKQNKETLKQFFETGDKPTQQQYADLIDSYVDAKQAEGEANRRFVIDETGEVNVTSEQQVPEYMLSPISGTNTVDLLKDGVSVSQIDLTPYLDNTNLARLVSGTVDTNGVATFTRDDNSTFTVDLSNLKDAVPQYQAGTNIIIDNTDPLQPVINATGGSGGATDLSYDATTRTLVSSTGTDAVIPLADATNAGLQKANFYEEGFFTPSIIDKMGSATYNYNVSLAEYIRTGNLVHFNIWIREIESVGTPTGNITIDNLPFPCSNITSAEVGQFINAQNFNFYSVKSDVYSDEVRFTVQQDLDGSTGTSANSVAMLNGQILVSGTYKTNVYTP
ncbi:hypothetical protein [Tenacibaculum discolor]|uniref:hypothetical protein n=1 Tax=Tenacibaculum discolor TaxID=361581 RepID=UPI000F592F9C|nr:hypothetical protein [Tenacibaculum discolor]